MKCWRCGGRTESQRVRYCIADQSPPLLITNLPAEVCRQCGERTYSTRTLNVLKRIRDGEAPNPQLGHLIVHDFDEIDPGASPGVSDFEVSSHLVVTGKTGVGIEPIVVELLR